MEKNIYCCASKFNENFFDEKNAKSSRNIVNEKPNLDKKLPKFFTRVN